MKLLGKSHKEKTVVDFGTKNNYDVILGRSFMHQLKMVQDWGYDYIYLRHMGNVT